MAFRQHTPARAAVIRCPAMARLRHISSIIRRLVTVRVRIWKVRACNMEVPYDQLAFDSFDPGVHLVVPPWRERFSAASQLDGARACPLGAGFDRDDDAM